LESHLILKGASKTKYTYVIDSDDVFIPTSLSAAWIGMKLSPHLSAISGFPGNFEKLDYAVENINLFSNGEFWKPIGHSDTKALSLYENHYIAASAMVKTETIKNFGGWDDTDKSTWEDWSFYSKLAWNGYTFSLIPAVGYLYRNTPGSMSKTYNRFFGRQRLIRNLNSFSKLDANIILSMLHYIEKEREKNIIIHQQQIIINEKNKSIAKLEKIISKTIQFSFVKKPISKLKSYKEMVLVYRDYLSNK